MSGSRRRWKRPQPKCRRKSQPRTKRRNARWSCSVTRAKTKLKNFLWSNQRSPSSTIRLRWLDREQKGRRFPSPLLTRLCKLPLRIVFFKYDPVLRTSSSGVVARLPARRLRCGQGSGFLCHLYAVSGGAFGGLGTVGIAHHGGVCARDRPCRRPHFAGRHKGICPAIFQRQQTRWSEVPDFDRSHYLVDRIGRDDLLDGGLPQRLPDAED